jgi:hypothetical protein
MIINSLKYLLSVLKIRNKIKTEEKTVNVLENWIMDSNIFIALKKDSSEIKRKRRYINPKLLVKNSFWKPLPDLNSFCDNKNK